MPFTPHPLILPLWLSKTCGAFASLPEWYFVKQPKQVEHDGCDGRGVMDVTVGVPWT